MVTFQQLYADPSFDPVQEAADHWRRTSKDLTRQGEDFARKVDIHTWASGEMAVAAHTSRDRITAQLSAGATEATAIAQILQFAYEELTAQNKRFQAYRAEVEAQGFPVYADGTIGIPTAPTILADYPELSDEWVDTQRGIAVGFAEGFGEILIKATEVDESIEANLRTAIGYDSGTEAFNPAAVGDQLDIADQIADAEHVRELLQGTVNGELTPEQWAELNALLAEHDGDATFATTLFNDLGPQGLINTLGSADLDFGGQDPPDQYIADFQQHMGESLGLAMDPANQPHLDGAAWAAELNRLGTEPVTLSHRDDQGNEVPVTYPGGYQVFGPLLQYGEYDKSFLVPVVDGMANAYAAREPDWTQATGSAQLPVTLASNPFDAANPDHVNPLNSGLMGLSHNPESATEFYQLDGGKHIDELILAEGTRPLEMSGGAVSVDIIGDSLEAATTGYDFDGPDYQPRIPHTEGMAAITGHLVTHVGNIAILVEGQYLGMADNFGRITADYIEDFHHALAGENPSKYTDVPPPFGVGVDFTHIKHETAENPPLEQWLQVIGHDEMATATVYGASEHLMIDTITHNATDMNPEMAADAHGRLAGELVDGRLEGIRDGLLQKAADHNDVVKAYAETAKFGTGYGLALTPLGPGAGTLAGTATGYLIDDIANRFMEDPTQDIYAAQTAARNEAMSNLLDVDGVPDRIREALIAGGCPPDLVDEQTDKITNEMLDNYVGAQAPELEPDGSDPRYR